MHAFDLFLPVHEECLTSAMRGERPDDSAVGRAILNLMDCRERIALAMQSAYSLEERQRLTTLYGGVSVLLDWFGVRDGRPW